MTTHTPIPAPDHLGAVGVDLWDSIASKYALRPDELARLDLACITAEALSTLDKAWRDLGSPMVTRGSMGQEVIHPLIGELRAQRAALEGMLVRLKLPDLDAGDVPAVNQQRDAANTKWATGRGRGA